MARYWINIEAQRGVTIHRAGCGFCPVQEDDTVSDWGNMRNWRGHYASRGAAIDAALAVDRPIVEHQVCITDHRINEEAS